MAPKSKITASVFQERYGNLVSREFSEMDTPYKLMKALAARKPPINVTMGMLKDWFTSQRIPSDAVQVSSAEDLQEKCGSFLGSGIPKNHLAGSHPGPWLEVSPSVHGHDTIAIWSPICSILRKKLVYVKSELKMKRLLVNLRLK